MKKPRHVSRNESSEEIEEIDQYASEYPGQCTPGIEKFFIAMTSGGEEEIIHSLLNLSEELSMTEEQILISQPLEKILTLLLECLTNSHEEILLQSMTCITLILDTSPDLSEVIIECEGLQIICEKISNLTEVSGQGIRALEKISLEFPLEVLEARAIESCINVIEYLDLEMQKKILNIICNSIKALQTQDSADNKILPIFPQILELLKNKSNLSIRLEKVLEFITCFIENLMMIIPSKGDSFKPYAKALVDFGLINILLEIFPSQSDYILRLLYTLCERSSLIVKKFLSVGGFNIIKTGIEGNSSKSIAFTEVLDLLDSILPRVPATDSWSKEKLIYFTKNPRFIQEISELILPRTKTIAEKYLSKEDKAIIISILEKILKISNIEQISHYLTCQSFSTFLSELMASKDLSTVRAALRISLNLYEKIPSKVSGNFIREGVISRISALKDQDRLKDFKKLPDKRFGGNIEEIMFRPNESKNPYQIETMINKIKVKVLKPASLDEYKKELQIYAKKILEKHKAFENKKVPRIGKEVKAISQKLNNCFGESAHELLVKITSLLNSNDKLSFYEISNSAIAESLWKWLAEGTPDKVVPRLSEFLRIFSKDSSHNEMFFVVLAKYMIGTANFVHHFRILLHDHKALSFKRNQKVKIVLEYAGGPGNETWLEDEAYRTRHDLFSIHHKIQFNSSLLLTFEKLRELLIRLSNESDIYTLVQNKIISETTVHMFLDRPYTASYQILFLNGGKEVPRGQTVLNLSSKKSAIQLRFKLIKRPFPDLAFKYLRGPADVFDSLISESSSIGIDAKDKSYAYLRLSKFLFLLSEYFPHLNYLLNTPSLALPAFETFNCSKLSALLLRQLQDSVSIEGNTPATWVKTLPGRSRYLFSSESRTRYLESFGFVSVSQIEKKYKARVSRAKLLQDSVQLMQDTGLHMETVLEIEYEGEAGTGLGPTVEFFALVSIEVRALAIWRNMCEDSALFPAPLSESEAGWEELFEFIGRLIGKAIIDKRHIDFRLSSTFWKLIFNQPVSLIDLQSVDLNVGKHLIDLYIHPNDVEKTGLVFTLPGYDSIELKANGSRIYVNKSNLDEYIYLCSSITLNQIPQAKALRRGLDSIIPVDILALMTLNEIEDLLLGENESHWEIEVLKQFICPSHGFNENSKTFLNLLNVLSKLTQENRKKFLEFVTGFPRLPIGGFEKLQPRLTVVKKDDFLEPDSCLPSVMTCQNYLKIPDYSCEEILESKLLMAINEGRQAFHLS